MNVIKLCAAAVLALCAVMILRDSKHPHPEYIVMSVGAIIAVRVIGNLSSAVECLRSLANGGTVSGYLPLLLRGAGISYLTDFTSGLCRDAGEDRIAHYVELAGRSELLLLSLPLMTELAELSLGMLNI